MKENHFIAIIVAILVLGIVFFSVGNISLPGSGSGSTESMDNLWDSSKNVEISSEDGGTHMKGINNEACWVALTSGDEQLFINSKGNFTLEMDAKVGNMVAFYLVNSLESNGDIYVVPNDNNAYQHITFNYTSSEHNLTYSVNGNIVKTMKCDFNGKPVGFKMVDWQGDMDVTIKNLMVLTS